jgi:hypothetical protein
MKAVIIFLLSSFALSMSNGIDIPVRKRVFGPGENPLYAFSFRVPCEDIQCKKARAPSNLYEAFDRIEEGLESSVLDKFKRAFINSCRGAIACTADSSLFWERFDNESKKIYVDEWHRLNDYTYALYYSIAEAFSLERSCAPDAELCAWLHERVSASPYMLSQMLFRGAILSIMGKKFDFKELVDGMDGMVMWKKEE